MALTQDELKKMVGYKAVDDYVKSGMVVGLGTGSTAYFAVERVGMKLKSGELKDIVCIPTSERTKEQALGLGIPLVTLNEKSRLDVAIDGADDVDPNLCLVKGGGGALLREKMVEVVSDKFICIVDESKLSKGLGPGFPLPVEITPFCHEHTLRLVEGLPSVKGCKAVLRMGSIANNKVRASVRARVCACIRSLSWDRSFTFESPPVARTERRAQHRRDGQRQLYHRPVLH